MCELHPVHSSTTICAMSHGPTIISLWCWRLHLAKGETAHIKPKVPKKTVRSSVFESDGIVALAAAMVIIWHGVNISDKKYYPLSIEREVETYLRHWFQPYQYQ